MARNKIQFQKGLNESEFQIRYGTETLCEKALERMRWPDGFVCPECGHRKGCYLKSRRLHQCAKCHTQTSLTAGTVFHGTRLPLTVWFRAMYHLTQSKNGVSALELMRRLGVSYNSAWLMKHKLMQAMKEREAPKVLIGRIEMDDAYLGGARAGARGRGAEGKTPFIAAVETDEAGKPQRMVMQVVKGFTSADVIRFAERKLHPSAHVISDGLGCFASVTAMGCAHTPIVTGSGRKAAQNPAFRWVNTALGNIKAALTGTYRHVSSKHVPRYLAEFQYRFNRRHDLPAMLMRLGYAAVRTPPMPYRLLKLAETYA